MLYYSSLTFILIQWVSGTCFFFFLIKIVILKRIFSLRHPHGITRWVIMSWMNWYACRLGPFMMNLRLCGYWIKVIFPCKINSKLANHFSNLVSSLIQYRTRFLKVTEGEADHVPFNTDVYPSQMGILSRFYWLFLIFFARNVALDTHDCHVIEIFRCIFKTVPNG